MRAGSRRGLLALVAALIPCCGATAAAPSGAAAIHVPQRLRRVLIAPLLNDGGPAPQAVAPADSQGPTVNPGHLDHPAQIERQLRDAVRRPLRDTRLTVTGGIARVGDYSVGSAEVVRGHVVVLEGDAEVHGRVDGNVVALDGDVTIFPGGVIAGDALAIGGKVRTVGTGSVTGTRENLAAAPGTVGTPATPLTLTVRHAAGVAGLFFSLVVLGFGLVTFGRPNLEIVSDTVAHSFGRSLLVGLLGQILVLPTFGMIAVGLALTVAGVLLIPFALVVFAVLVAVTTIIGLLAVSHAMGERITRRQMARGIALSPNSYRYLLTGLGAVSVIWIGWVLFGWVPVAGVVMLVTAGLTTWSIATVGLGAALLSRGGIREHFTGRMLAPESMTDEYLWATPQLGVPAVKRPESGKLSS